MKIIALETSDSFVTKYVKPNTVHTVYAHIQPQQERYSLVLIDVDLGARDIKSSDKILYLHPSVNPRNINGGWLAIYPEHLSDKSEASFIEINSNEEALHLLNK